MIENASNGRSLWDIGIEEPSVPILCECGYRRKIGRNGTKEASFFYDEITGEFVCGGCGLVRRV